MPEVFLHLGAHKTATTYIQDVLNEFRPGMAAAGCFYVPLTRSRVAITGPQQQLRRTEGSIRAYFFRRQLKKTLSSYLGALPGEHRDVLISDENLLGEIEESLGGSLYPTAAGRLQQLSGLIPAPVRRVYLGVRDYAPFLTSLYIEGLRWGTKVTPEKLVANYGTPARHWSQLVGSIKAAFPQAQLHIWRFEDFPLLRSQLLASLSRLPEDVIGASLDRIVRPGISKDGVESLLETFQTVEGAIGRQFAALAAEGRHPRRPGDAVYDPWPADVRRAISAVYEQELAEWLNDPRITLLRPQAHAAATAP